MNIELRNEINPAWGGMLQVMFNRGISVKDFNHYLNLSSEDINSPLLLGESKLIEGFTKIFQAATNRKKTVVLVDCDCDGYTSAALFINYFYKVFPEWVENDVDWIMHSDKSHGLSNHIEEASNYDLVICPDSSSNEPEIHKELIERGSKIVVLDHHLSDRIDTYATIINNQLSDYPNKDLSGVGVVWQFCRYADMILNTHFATEFLDLVALGNCGDMMDLHSFETRYLISLGFNKENIKNPFIKYIIDKNNFSLNKGDYKTAFLSQACTSMGAAFFIVPFINATTRSGTLEEKNLIFESMLTHKAFEKVDEIKWGKPTGRKEYLVSKAMRVITNIKKRQTNTETAGMELAEKKIEKENLLDNSILLILTEGDEFPSEIRGLIANKLMAKYQRPCMILTRKEDMYEGSMRGYNKTGLNNFKDFLEKCPGITYVQGHENAAGVGLQADKVSNFIEYSNKELKGKLSKNPIHRVDYYFKDATPQTCQTILDIARMNDFWGEGFERSYVGIEFKITKNNFTIMKGNTLKITLPNGLTLIKFRGSEEDIKNLSVDGWVNVVAYCKCNENEWMGQTNPQLIIEDYEILQSCNYIF